MLNLSRRKEEKLFIQAGDKIIEILICDIERGKVRLGITAPKDVAIWRDDARQHAPILPKIVLDATG